MTDKPCDCVGLPLTTNVGKHDFRLHTPPLKRNAPPRCRPRLGKITEARSQSHPRQDQEHARHHNDGVYRLEARDNIGEIIGWLLEEIDKLEGYREEAEDRKGWERELRHMKESERDQ